MGFVIRAHRAFSQVGRFHGQIEMPRFEISIWDFEFVWDLGLGI